MPVFRITGEKVPDKAVCLCLGTAYLKVSCHYLVFNVLDASVKVVRVDDFQKLRCFFDRQIMDFCAVVLDALVVMAEVIDELNPLNYNLFPEVSL